jgi:hypothetical protein
MERGVYVYVRETKHTAIGNISPGVKAKPKWHWLLF